MELRVCPLIEIQIFTQTSLANKSFGEHENDSNKLKLFHEQTTGRLNLGRVATVQFKIFRLISPVLKLGLKQTLVLPAVLH
jgi:hypothetical protein